MRWELFVTRALQDPGSETERRKNDVLLQRNAPQTKTDDNCCVAWIIACCQEEH